MRKILIPLVILGILVWCLGCTGTKGPVFDTSSAIETIRYLSSDIGSRTCGGAKERAAFDWLAAQLRTTVWEPHMVEFKFEQVIGRMAFSESYAKTGAIGWPNGGSRILWAGDPQPKIIVGAHIDSIGPEANDNASGVAVLLQVARTITSTREPTQLVFFGCEEVGLLGSQFWAENGPKPKYMVSVDMIGFKGKSKQLLIVSNSGLLGREMASFDPSVYVYESNSQPVGTASDNWSYQRQGVEAGWVGWFDKERFRHYQQYQKEKESGYSLGMYELGVHYNNKHRPEDTVDAIDKAALKKAGQWILNYLK